VVSCPNCSKKLETESSFLNVSLELDQCYSTRRRNDSSDSPPVVKTAPRHLDLKKLVEVHMRSEVLDVENEWECPSCCSNVQAVKHHEYRTLPPNLMIHLQRLKYNSVSHDSSYSNTSLGKVHSSLMC
jgi:ubiquitin C-terminal hydrolase